MTRIRCLSVALVTLLLAVAPATAQQRWSEGPEYTVVQKPQPVDRRLVGSWDLWISGGVDYVTDGRDVFQRYTPGAGRGRIVVGGDGRYQWGSYTGRMVEVRPYFAQDHLRYWLLRDQAGSYVVTYEDGGALLRILHSSGGIMATGDRPGAARNGATQAMAEPAPASPAPSQAPAHTGMNPLGVEWRGAQPAPTQAPSTRSAPATSAVASNPLGMEWRSGASSNPPPAATRQPNPLGVEWHTAATPARPSPSPVPPPPPTEPMPATGSPAPARPSPSSPAPAPTPIPTPTPTPAPSIPDGPPSSSPGASPVVPAAPVVSDAVAIAGVWGYRKMRFGPGVDGEMSVRGTLTLRSDGSYRQELLIGEFVNPYTGSYTQAGPEVQVVNPSHEERWSVRREGDRLFITVVGTTPPIEYVLELMPDDPTGGALP